jgi:hypothetical protein
MRRISAGEDRRVALLREFERSGLSMAEFRRRREVGYSAMAAWRRSCRERSAAFVEVEPEDCGHLLTGRSNGRLSALRPATQNHQRPLPHRRPGA